MRKYYIAATVVGLLILAAEIYLVILMEVP